MALISSNSHSPITSLGLYVPRPLPTAADTVLPTIIDTVTIGASEVWKPMPRSFSASASSYSTPAGSQHQGSATLNNHGLTASGSFSDHAGPAGGGRITAQAQLGPVTLNASAEGSHSLGLHQSGQGSLNIGPNGISASGTYQQVVGAQAQGKVSTSASLGPVSLHSSLEARALVGSRTQVGGAQLGGLGQAPGHSSGPASLSLNAQGGAVDVGFSHFTGAEASLTHSAGLQTPVASLNSTTSLRAAYGVGASGAARYQASDQRFAVGLGGSFELGESLTLRNDTSLTTPNGSGLNLTTAAGVGGKGGELSAGFVRDNAAGTTSFGTTAILPIPPLGIQAGGGTQFVVADADLQGVARIAGGPLLGDAAASAVKPVMNTVPVVARAAIETNPVMLGVKAAPVVAAAAPTVLKVAADVLDPFGIFH
jgi:hypothetical protein